MRASILILAGLLCAAGSAQDNGGWKPLFDGTSLKGWNSTPFPSHGTVTVTDGAITLGKGYLTGVNYTEPFPKVNYEVRMEAMRVEGSDFFAGITFPVRDSFCTWINGGWGGILVGLSSLNGLDASENDTTTSRNFAKNKWYALRLRVTDDQIAAWIDEEPLFEVNYEGIEIGLRPGEIELSKPFGIAAYSTVAKLRKIEYRVLAKKE